MNIVNVEKDKKKLQRSTGASFATVIEVIPEKGVKIRIDGEESALNTYYNSYVIVNEGDRVGIKRVSGTIVIEGKLQY